MKFKVEVLGKELFDFVNDNGQRVKFYRYTVRDEEKNIFDVNSNNEILTDTAFCGISVRSHKASIVFV